MKRLLLLFVVCVSASPAVAAETVRYNRDVRPILSDNCFACHGPDSVNRQAGLRLDVREAAVLLSSSGSAAIVPGNPTESELVARIASDDVDVRMPPPKSHKKLSAPQKDILKRWIAEGAKYEKHWAFLPVQPVKVPTAADLPTTIDHRLKSWPRNPIDWFILERLANAGLKPSPQAEAATLARRIALDLTGLPPRVEEVQEFVSQFPSSHHPVIPSSKRDEGMGRSWDDGSAYAILIDRLFASPHYGERMAVDWLDAARYADTQGY